MKIFFLGLMLSIASLIIGQNSVSVWEISRITVDHVISPINIENSIPNISWQIASSGKRQMQSAYRMQIASNEQKLNSGSYDYWDSGKIKSSQSSNIYPHEINLKSNSDYYVKVTSWNQDGLESSAMTSFSTSLLKQSDWVAQWIGYGNLKDLNEGSDLDSLLGNRSQYLRKDFIVKKAIKRARVFVTGLGQYELYLNGEKASDHVMSPAKTRYIDRVLYDVLDVKKYLIEGGNSIGIHLGNGWFNSNKKYRDWRMPFYGLPTALMQLEIEYADFSKETIVSDKSWKVAFGPIFRNCIYDGESYDANLEIKGWNKYPFNDHKWKPVSIMENPGQLLQTQTMQPERVVSTLNPIKTYYKNKHTTLYDMGQNFSGWTKIKVQGIKGTTIKIRHAEQLNFDVEPELNVETNRKAENTDIYILNGDGIEEYEPHFTFHGFQFVEVSVDGEADVLSVTGKVVHTDVSQTSKLETDNSLINHIHHCALWSLKSNLHGLPTDCPQRDERLGWLADGYLVADEILINFDSPLFFQKWLDDMRYAQSASGELPHIAPTKIVREETNWSCGYIILLWEYYKTFGDVQFIEKHYPTMCKYINFLENHGSINYIVKNDRYGDWMNPAQDDKKNSGWVRGTPESSTTMMFFYCTDILEKFARILGKSEDVKKFGYLKQNISKAFNNKFYDSQTNTFQGEEYHFQYLQGLPLYFGLVAETDKKKVLNNLIKDITVKRKGHVFAGIIGVKYIVEALALAGKNDIVYDIVTAKGYPGWDYMLSGLNTFPEQWNKNGSLNHAMFASIDGWFFRSLAGIKVNPAHVGYEQFLIEPFFPNSGLNKVNASIETVKGKIASSWNRKGNMIIMNVEIPVNTTAKVILPISSHNVEVNKFKWDINKDVNKLNLAHKSFELGSGKYEILFTIQ